MFMGNWWNIRIVNCNDKPLCMLSVVYSEVTKGVFKTSRLKSTVIFTLLYIMKNYTIPDSFGNIVHMHQKVKIWGSLWCLGKQGNFNLQKSDDLANVVDRDFYHKCTLLCFFRTGNRIRLSHLGLSPLYLQLVFACTLVSWYLP